MNVTQTTPHISTPGPKPRFLLIYALIPMVLFALLLGILGVVLCLRRKSRLDYLRHRLIPVYRYDPTEDFGFGDCEEEELTEHLYPEGRLSLLSGRSYTGCSQ